MDDTVQRRVVLVDDVGSVHFGHTYWRNAIRVKRNHANKLVVVVVLIKKVKSDERLRYLH